MMLCFVMIDKWLQSASLVLLGPKSAPPCARVSCWHWPRCEEYFSIGQNIGARGPADFGRSLWTMHLEVYPSLTRNGYDVYALLCKRYMNDLAVDAKQIITSDEGEGQCHPCCLNSSVVKLANLDSQPCRQT